MAIIFLFLVQGLHLFNLDMIREHGTRDRFYVIDINYFPGNLWFYGLVFIYCSAIQFSNFVKYIWILHFQGMVKCQNTSIYLQTFFWNWLKPSTRNVLLVYREGRPDFNKSTRSPTRWWKWLTPVNVTSCPWWPSMHRESIAEESGL